MRKLAVVVGVCLVFTLLAGLTLRPDDGTQVDLSPAKTGAVVSGANHGKPLPRVPSAQDLVRVLLAFSSLVLAALVLTPVSVTVVQDDADRWPNGSPLLARAIARRGPPARA